MSDTSGKRAPKPFEPPPWERDAFEELKRRREADEAAAREMQEARAQLEKVEALKARASAVKADEEDPVVTQARLLAAAELAKEQGSTTAAPVTTATSAAPAAAGAVATEARVAAATPVTAPEGEDAVPAEPPIDDRKVAEMLAVLSVQEPKAKSGGTLALIAAAVLVILGVGMMIVSVWWQTAGPKAGAAPLQLMLQSMLVGGFGLGFTVVGGLIGYQSTQQARS